MNLLSPEAVVLGGGVSEAMGSRLLPIVADTAKAYAFPQAMRGVRIVAATLGDDAGVLGAAELARRKIQEGRISEREEPEEKRDPETRETVERSPEVSRPAAPGEDATGKSLHFPSVKKPDVPSIGSNPPPPGKAQGDIWRRLARNVKKRDDE